LTFCESCQSEHRIVDLVQAALDSIATVGIDYSREYFEFVDAVSRLENQSIEADRGFLEEEVLKTVPRWAPTFLLSPVDGQTHIRHATMDILKRLVFNPLEESETEDLRLHRQLRGLVQEFAKDAQAFAHSTFLTSRARENAALSPGQANQLIEVVEHCLGYFDLDNAQEVEQVNSIQTTMAALRAKAESAVETMSADWQENSSELAELSTEDFEELQSP